MSKEKAEKRWFVEKRCLPDKYTVLEGDGKLRRHIKLLTQEEIKSKHVREYLVLAFKAAMRP